MTNRAVSPVVVATALAAGAPGCSDDYADAPRYELTNDAGGRPRRVRVEHDATGRFVLDVPEGTRGFLIHLDPADGESTTSVEELIGPEPAGVSGGSDVLIASNVYESGDGSRLAASDFGTVVGVPHRLAAQDMAGTWRVRVTSGVGELEVWTAPVQEGDRLVDIDVFVSEVRVFESELRDRLVAGLALLDLQLGELAVHVADVSSEIDLRVANSEFASLPPGDAGSVSIVLYASIANGGGYSPIPGIPRRDGRPGVLVLEETATPMLIAHELGHFAGLFHTTDGEGQDLLESTAECSDDVFGSDPSECPDLDNLMAPHPIDTKLTDEQRYVIAHSLIWHQ